MKNQLRILPLVVAVAAALTLSACTKGGSSATAGSTLSKIRKSGSLRVAVMVGEEPGFIKGSNGTWSGYCYLIEQQIAKDLNLKVVPVETTWGNMALDVQTGKLDIAACAQPTAQRAEVVDYTTHAIYTNYFSLIVAKNSKPIKNWSDLNAKDVKIGVQTGDSTIQPIKMFAPNATIVTFQTRDQGLLALQSGRIDAEANTLLNSLQAVKSRADLNAHVVVPEPVVAAPSAVLVRRDVDQSFQHVVDTEVWNLTSSGFNRSAILQSLATYGVTASDLPVNAPL